MRLLLVASVVGELVSWFAFAFIAPWAMAMWDRDWTSAGEFLVAGVLTWLAGVLMSWRFERPRVFYRSEALAVVAFSWLAISTFAAMPYVMVGLGPVDALFESMSGLTTTGATILTDFDHHRYTRSFWLWRAMTQWFGGLGVIALFVVVLPRLGIAGRQLFFAEASGAPGEAVSPQVRDAAWRLWILYTTLTVLCTTLLVWNGFTLYEAACHAFTTLSAGGFSPNGSSVAGYANPGAEWALVIFMFLSGASYPLQYKLFTGDWRSFFRNGEFRFYLGFNLGGALLIAWLLTPTFHADHSFEALRLGAFQATSLSSSTGFASTDYEQWPDAARAVLVLLMVVGGCAGSAAGGVKCVRHLLVTKHLLREIRQALHPRAVIPVLYQGRLVPNEVMRSVFALAVLYAGGYLVLGLWLVITEVDVITGFSASLACLGNIGPGFAVVGPMGNYSEFSWVNKLVLFGAMWIGRLEILTVLALLHPDVLANLRFRRE